MSLSPTIRRPTFNLIYPTNRPLTNEIKNMKTNIFLNSYQQPENKLTYNFLSLIELLNNKNLCEFLTGLSLSNNPVKNVRTVYGGGETNPDGSFDLTTSAGKMVTIYFENKTKRRGLSPEQIISHLNYCKSDEILLVVTTRKSDIEIIKNIDSSKIKFLTWTEIATFIKTGIESEVAQQFVHYGKMSGEFEELGELTKEDILLRCEYQKLNYDKRINNILNDFVYELDFSKYGFNNEKIIKVRRNTWGRNGVEVNWDRQGFSYGQWWSFGYYYDTNDHGISFSKDVPEIVAFFDVNPENRQTLEDDPEFNSIIEELVKLGFESNLRGQLTNNRWRLFIYRKSIFEFNIINASEMLNFTDEVFSKLLQTNAKEHRYFNEFI